MTRRKILITAVVAVLLVGLYALVGFVWAPRFLASEVKDFVQRDYGRSVSLGAIRINPFTFELEVRDFSLPDADGRPMLGFSRFYLDFQLSSLWHRAWTFREIEIEQPYVRVVQRHDGRLNLLDLAPPRAAPPSAAPAGGGVPAVWIDDLGVTGGRVDVADDARPVPFATTLQPVTFRLAGFRTVGGRNSFAFSAGSDLAGRLDVDGSFHVAPFASQGSLKLSGLQAAAVTRYLGDLLPVRFESGTLDVGCNYDFSLAGRPYRLTLDVPALAIHDLATLARGQDTPWRFRSVDVAGGHVDVAAHSVSVQSIAIAGVEAPAWLDANGIHLPGVLGQAGEPAPARPAATPAAAPATPAAPAAAVPAWKVSLPSIKLTDADVPFQDRRLPHPAPLSLKVTSLSLQDFAWPIAAPLAVEADIASAAGGHVGAKGTLELEPLKADLDLRVEALDLTPVQPYLDGRTDLLFDSGKLDSRGKLQLSAASPLDLRFTGEVALRQLRTRDRPLKQDFINWQSLDLTGIQLTTHPARLAIADIVAHRPYLRLVLDPNGISNVETVLHPEAAAAKAAAIAAGKGAPAPQAKPASRPKRAASGHAPPPSLPLAITIRRTRVVDGNVNFTDFTTEPHFHIAVEQLQGAITGSSSDPKARAKVELDGKVDRYAPAHIAGQLNLLAPDAFIDIGASFHNIELTSFNPYSTKFMGYQIDKGKLSIDTQYKVEDGRLEAQHHIRVDQLEFGDRIDSPDAIGLPIKLAVALLKDSNGVMDLELPVRGTVDDPQFKLGKIIWKAFVGLLTKAVTAPFKLLGSLFGGGADLSYIEFAPGSAALDAAALDKVASLAKALQERPALKLDIPWTAARDVDAAAIGQARWEQALEAAGGKDTSQAWKTDRAAYLRRLTALYVQKNGHKPELPEPPKPAAGEAKPDPVEFDIGQLEPGLKAGFAASDDDLAALAQARAEAVRDALLKDGKIDPARVFVVRGETAQAEAAGVRMKLSLK